MRANKFIVYFQNFSNTYDTLENLKAKYDSALIDERIISEMFTADHKTLMALFEMTPYVHRTKQKDIERLQAMDHMDITASFVIRTFRR